MAAWCQVLHSVLNNSLKHRMLYESMFLFFFPTRGLGVFTLYISHYSVKPLVSRVAVALGPGPTLLCSALSGLRSVVPGH